MVLLENLFGLETHGFIVEPVWIRNGFMNCMNTFSWRRVLLPV